MVSTIYDGNELCILHLIVLTYKHLYVIEIKTQKSKLYFSIVVCDTYFILNTRITYYRKMNYDQDILIHNLEQ